MAYAPIALTMPQYEDYANWYLKAYTQGTTTPLSMATNSGGGTTLAKSEIDANGFPTTDGSARFIPYINGAYDLWMFPTSAEADANDTTNAIQLADNINADPASAITVTTVSYAANISALLAIDGTVESRVNTSGYHTAGDGGGGEFYWDASQDKADHNGGTIIDPDITFPSDWTNQTQVTTWFTAGTGTGCWMRVYDFLTLPMCGAKGDGTTNDWLALNAGSSVGAPIYITDGTYVIGTTGAITGDVIFSGGVIKVSSTFTLTVNGTITGPQVQCFDLTGGSLTISKPQEVYLDWFGNDSAEVGGNGVMTRCLASIAPGTTVLCAGLYDEMNDFTLDPDNHRGVEIRGIGNAHPRYYTTSDGHGAHFRHKDDAASDFVTIGNGTTTRMNGAIRNIRFDGNFVASNDYGTQNIINFTGVIDFILEDINCQYAERDCISFIGTLSNQITFAGTIECANYKRSGLYAFNTGDGIIEGALVTSGGTFLTAPAEGQVGVRLWGGWKIANVRSYSNQDFGCQINGVKNSIGVLHVDTNNAGGVEFTDAATDNHIAELRTNNIGSNTGLSNADRSAIRINTVSARNTVGILKYTEQGSQIPYFISIASSCPDNHVYGITNDAEPSSGYAQILGASDRNTVWRKPFHTETATTGSITIDTYRSEVVKIGPMTGNVTIPNISSALGRNVEGLDVSLEFEQDATGGRTVSWGSEWIATTTVSATANLKTYIKFKRLNSKWIEIYGVSGY